MGDTLSLLLCYTLLCVQENFVQDGTGRDDKLPLGFSRQTEGLNTETDHAAPGSSGTQNGEIEYIH